MGRRRLKPRLVCATLLLGLSAMVVDATAGGTCSAERPREIFAALEKIDEAGEAELKRALTELSERENWSQGEWEAYALGLAESPQANALAERLDQLVTQVFGVLTKPPIDCDRLDALESEILDTERQQWAESLAIVRRRLERAPSAKAL